MYPIKWRPKNRKHIFLDFSIEEIKKVRQHYRVKKVDERFPISRFPPIADYECLEELNNRENVETAIYEASKKFTW